MRFCPWYPLAEAAAHAPAAEGVLQLRVAEGLIDYPRGKSAMIHYEHAADVRAAALTHEAAGVLCRHLELEPGDPVDYAAIYAKLLHEFIRRFGAAPGTAQR